MNRYFICVLLISCILAPNSYSYELKITSENLEVDRKNNMSIFSGNVYAFNDEIRIWSEELMILLNESENKIKKLEAKNKVKIIKQNVTATGESSVYYPDTGIVNMYGNVEVHEDNNIVKCDELFLDINNSLSIMKSSPLKKVEASIISD